MHQAAFFGARNLIERVWKPAYCEQVVAFSHVYPEVIDGRNFAAHVDQLHHLEVIFATWGMPALSSDDLARLPSLRAVFYAAGSVQEFARSLLERDIVVVSAWQANAVPVAEFTLAQILLANKGYFRNTAQLHAREGWRTAFRGTGNFEETISILGAGAIGRKLIELLRPFRLQVLVYDPFLPPEEARRLGVTIVSLEEAFERGLSVSNHLANVPATVGLLNAELFERMRPNATFLNTGRGATVDEPGLIRVLQARRDLMALLDVMEPEPPLADSLLYTLPNVQLSSHIAGSIGHEVALMAEYCVEEFLAWHHGQPLRYAVTLEMLETMA